MRSNAMHDDLEQAASDAREVMRLAAGGALDQDALHDGADEQDQPESATSGSGSTAVILPPGVPEECDLVTAEGDRRRALRLLGEALQHGAIRGEVGAMDAGAISVTQLQSALGEVGGTGLRGDEANSLVESSREVLRLRVALLSDNWVEAGAVLSRCRLPGSDALAVDPESESTESGDEWTPHALCLDETRLASLHVLDWRVRHVLIGALEGAQV